jgi:zinc protease
MKKNSSYILFLLLASFCAKAQMGKPYEMMINGVKVIVQPSGNDIVEIQTIIKGGVQNYPPEKQGIESMALTALTECGTLKDDKNSFKNTLDKVSAQVGGYTNMDYASFSMNCIKSDFNTVWPLYIDALTIPKFDAKEFDRIRQDQVNNIRANESNPDAAIRKMARQIAFAGKNYAEDPEGTVETVTKLTPEETKKYFSSILTRSRIVIVVVGDLDKETLQNNMTAFIAKLPAGAPFTLKKQSYTPTVSTLKPEKKDLATNYVEGITGAPLPGSPDYNAYVLAMRIFYDRHFLDIRTKNGLSYAPITWLNQGAAPYASIFASTTDPNKYIVVARQLIDRIKKEGFTPEELKNIKTSYLTGIYYRQETNSAEAATLASNEVLFNNWRRTNSIKEEMSKVTLADLNKAFGKYFTNITWAYQGDPSKVDAKLFTQKETPKLPKEIKAF